MNAKPEHAELARDARLDSLRRTDLLDALPEPYLDRITGMVMRLLKADTALLSLVEADRQFFASHCGLPEPYATTRETPLSHSFCKYVVASNKPLVVPDARLDPLVADNGAVRDLGVISYLGVPVRDSGGRVLGSLCAIGATAHAWTDADVALLQDLAGIVEDEIELRLHARRAIELAEENAVLAREYHHRVKNALAVSASLVKLSAREAVDVDGLVQTSVARLTALASAHDALISHSDNVDLRDLAARLLSPYCGPGVVADLDGPAIGLRHGQVTPICFFLHELATNSAKYGAFSRLGAVAVRWERAGGEVIIAWEERTSWDKANEGFGSRLLEASARQLRGTFHVSRADDTLTVSLRFPAAPGGAGN